MSNEKLRQAITRAGLEVEDLAALVQVDAKTIGRWLSGRTPYPRHRARIATALGCDPHELWPEVDKPPAAGEHEADELIAAYPRESDPGTPDWRTLLDSAVEQIDLLDFTLADVLHDRHVIDLLATKAAAGCQVRILVSARDSAQLVIAEAEQGRELALNRIPDLAWDAERTLGYLQALLTLPTVEARTFIANRFNAVLRFDDQMLITLGLWGTTGPQAPLLHLKRRGEQGLFEQFAAHYDAIWHEAAEPLDPDPEIYPDPTTNPARYRPDTTRPSRAHA